MRVFTVYDNVDGGYTVKYRYYDYSAQNYKTKTWQCPNYSSMKNFTEKLRADGFKYVGKIN